MQKNLNSNITHSLFFVLIPPLFFFCSSSNAMGVFERAKLKLKSWRERQGHHKIDDALEDEQLERPVKPTLRVELDKEEGDGLQETIVFSAMGRTIFGDRSIDAVYTAIIEDEYEKREYIETLSYIIGAEKYGNVLIGRSGREKRPILYVESPESKQHENKQDDQHAKSKPNFHDDATVIRKVGAALVKYKNEINLLCKEYDKKQSRS